MSDAASDGRACCKRRHLSYKRPRQEVQVPMDDAPTGIAWAATADAQAAMVHRRSCKAVLAMLLLAAARPASGDAGSCEWTPPQLQAATSGAANGRLPSCKSRLRELPAATPGPANGRLPSCKPRRLELQAATPGAANGRLPSCKPRRRELQATTPGAAISRLLSCKRRRRELRKANSPVASRVAESFKLFQRCCKRPPLELQAESPGAANSLHRSYKGHRFVYVGEAAAASSPATVEAREGALGTPRSCEAMGALGRKRCCPLMVLVLGGNGAGGGASSRAAVVPAGGGGAAGKIRRRFSLVPGETREKGGTKREDEELGGVRARVVFL